MRIAVFGANGPTGRLLTEQALAAGHEVAAVTRRPAEFPITHLRLDVVEADAHDRPAVDRAVKGADAVLSTLGVPFTRRPVDVYSAGIHTIDAAMRRHGVRRLVAVSSSATEPHHHADGGFLMNRILQPVLTATIGRTTYADMRRMEEFARASDLDWTIMRPSGLFDAPGVTSYGLQENQAAGIFTSRADLAASMLGQATDIRFLRKFVAVTTSEGAPTLFQMLRREAFKRD
ncbi:NAD-dependent epimerase [Parafrankia colletiae]|uniref:NAD-dependent epimerase n=1 Tax=Parafrankia colletiae TaxID=573497 RepID=A0A1S1QFW6_9ACTN|nr:NAD(P)H-binding protein [Parafrankia colletiae]MCK9900390.1 NAD(P)H-binding protein [Frankia sp. Cpl3]OHV33693.1 NAD-dependent epimerase [Parafrankia colletiae]